MRRLVIWTSLTVLFTLPAVAQQRPLGFAAWQAGPDTIAAVAMAPPLAPGPTVAPADRDHRYEGLLIGGVAVGALGAWIGAGISASNDCLIQPGGGCGREDRVGAAVVGGLIGAALGGTLGYVIGRWGGGKPQAASADSTRR